MKGLIYVMLFSSTEILPPSLVLSSLEQNLVFSGKGQWAQMNTVLGNSPQMLNESLSETKWTSLQNDLRNFNYGLINNREIFGN